MLRGCKRIMIVGSGGVGKSTFARELGTITGLPVIHLDRHFWQPGWVPTPRGEWHQRLEALAAEEAWIIDGNYGNSLGIRVARCDAIVFLDFDRVTCLWGALQRSVLGIGRSRTDMGEGCDERFNPSYLRWVWQYPRAGRLRVVEAIEAASPEVEIVTLESRRAARRVLDSLSAE